MILVKIYVEGKVSVRKFADERSDNSSGTSCIYRSAPFYIYICIYLYIYIYIYNYVLFIIVYIILYISLLFNTFFCTSKLIKNKYNLVAKRDRIIIHCIFYIVVRRKRYISYFIYYNILSLLLLCFRP